jgi:L-2-hydroxyglutarate oxidase LhgO
MEKVDVVIIGAGVVGLAIANEISSPKKEVVVLERHNGFGQETSSRNSEVIHGGMYYPKDSLKAELCVEGRILLYELCQKHNLPYRKTGKIIVATDKSEFAELERIFIQGKNNGVEDLILLEKDEIHKREPNVCSIKAIYSPESGIIDSHRLMQFYLDASKAKGALVVYNCEVTAIEKGKDKFLLKAKNGNDVVELEATVIINSAGLDSDMVAQMAGIDIKRHKYQLYYCKGDYFRVNSNRAKLLNGLVYPVPQPKGAGLGIHATLDLGGGLRLGPDDEYLNSRQQDYMVRAEKLKVFYSSAKVFIPFINDSDLSVDTSGIRPKLQEPEGDFRDFIIQDEKDKGLPGLINLIGIESPGLTASPAIAKYVGQILKNVYH